MRIHITRQLPQPELPAKFARAFALLMESFRYAEQTSGRPWEFAVEIHELRNTGLCNNDLRFLVRRNFIIHAAEISVPGGHSRRFRSTGDLCFTPRTCFVLTPAGTSAAAALALSSTCSCNTK